MSNAKLCTPRTHMGDRKKRYYMQGLVLLDIVVLSHRFWQKYCYHWPASISNRVKSRNLSSMLCPTSFSTLWWFVSLAAMFRIDAISNHEDEITESHRSWHRYISIIPKLGGSSQAPTTAGFAFVPGEHILEPFVGSQNPMQYLFCLTTTPLQTSSSLLIIFFMSTTSYVRYEVEWRVEDMWPHISRQ